MYVSAEGNDIARARRRELFRRYRETLKRVNGFRGPPNVCGILPCRSVETRWWSEAYWQIITEGTSWAGMFASRVESKMRIRNF